MTSSTARSAIVLGAGPAGLTVASRLATHGLRVTVINRNSALGEHFRGESDLPVATLGCHHATWRVLDSIGVPRGPSTFSDSPLEFLLGDNRLVRFPRTRFPKPLHQLYAIGTFAGLSWKERWRLLSWLEQIWDGSLNLDRDLEHRIAYEWIEAELPTNPSLQVIGNAVARWLTGSDMKLLSADAFIESVRPFLLSCATDCRILVPTQSWSRIFIQPIAEQLARQGTALLLGNPAVRMDYADDRVTGIRLQDGAVLHADWYIAAVPHHQLTPLLPERWLTRYAFFQQIVDLPTRPLTVIQVRAAQQLQHARHILLIHGPFSWIACKPSESDRSLVAVLAMPPDRSFPDAEGQVCELLRSLGLLPPHRRLTDFRQQEIEHAILALSPGAKVRRPIQRSPIPNLLVAGAWTDTGWPANLESAIVSAERCAEMINHSDRI